MTTGADKTVYCHNCGEQSRAIWDYSTDEKFIVGQRDKGEYGGTCDRCGHVIDIGDQPDNWTPMD